MSTDARERPDVDPTPYPRVRSQPRHDYRKQYGRSQRAPMHDDERGAVAVFDLMEFDYAKPARRLAIVPIEGDKDFMRVVELPPPGSPT